MHIEIDLPRPVTTLLFVAALSGWGIVLSGPSAPDVTVQAQATAVSVSSAPVPAVQASSGALASAEDARGGDAAVPAETVPPGMSDDEKRMLEARQEEAALASQADIMRYQLTVLQDERHRLGANVDPALDAQFRESTKLLTSFILDQKKAEQFILTSLSEMWEAENQGAALAQGPLPAGSRIVIQWPVEPLLGISAYFADASYKAMFHMDHHADDIPTPQGTIVRAAAGGIVKDVVNHGLGFNYVTIEHPGGYSTLYGHLTKFSVQKGQQVLAGDEIGLSGGRPGSPGAGLSTGPHLHFALFINGKPVNALPFLPARDTVLQQGQGQ
jgi:murein DD-endopeptidase MepM/ murein hydrolase activator NlpD